MEELQPQRPVPKPKGIPLWTALVFLLVLAVVSAALLGFVLYRATSDKAKLERKLQAWESEKGQAELEKQKAAEQGKLAMARSRQNECLALVRNATNAIGTLWQKLERVQENAATLRTNDAGRAISRHPDLVTLARRLYETDLPEFPQREVVITKLEGERRFEQQLISAAGTAYEPDPNFTTTAQADALWATQESTKVDRAGALIATLIQDSKIKVAPANATSAANLQTALAELAQGEAALRQRLLAEKTSQAKVQATDTIGSAEAERIVQEAKLKAAKILEEANAQATKQQQEQSLRSAERKIDEAKANVAAAKATQEADKVRLRQKASNGDVQSKLAPFLAPGYMQLGTEAFTSEKLPLRWSEFVSQDLLSGSERSINNLVYLATTEKDKTRPRWRLTGKRYYDWKKTPGDIERLTEAQKLLKELGPTFVEMGLLRP
jgi:hypothetical protein